MNKLVLLVLFFCTVSHAQIFKDFTLKENTGINVRKVKFSHLNDVTVYDLEYHSFDNTFVKGFLITPNDKSKKYPVLIFNRGGNGHYGMVTEPYIVRFLSKIAAQGYIVIGSQLRGSEGSEGEDEWAGKDIDDVMFLFEIIDQFKNADTSRIVQMGWSRGGVTNFHLLKKTNRIKATITIAGPADLLSTNRKEMFKVYRNRIKDYAKDSIIATNRVSPIYQMDSIKNKKAPLLFLHGDKDNSVQIMNSELLNAKAKQIGIQSEMITYLEGDHGLMKQIDSVLKDVIEWLKQVL
jgi:dipeptidyl aminopeptidase/acylaminoacyl peptidase